MEIDSIRSGLMQELAALYDNPAQRATVELQKRYYPGAYGRTTYGSEEGLTQTQLQDLRAEWSSKYKPRGSVLSIAGKVQTSAVLASVKKYFGKWQGTAASAPPFGAMPKHQNYHIDFESAQLQIVMAYPSAKYGEKHYYDAKVASGVLSGGMAWNCVNWASGRRRVCVATVAPYVPSKTPCARL